MPSQTIDDILLQLQNIIIDSERTSSRIGYFAALYYKVTAAVKEGVADGRFADGPLMEKLDVTFANRYLDALAAWKNKQPVTASWRIAFEATGDSSLLILQQLLLGMSAHINLDLGIAAAAVAAGDLTSIRNDFDSINTVIASLTYQVINDIDRASPLMSLLGFHYDNQTSVLIQFSIDNARDGAWCFAEDLAAKSGAAYSQCIADRDQTIKKLGDGLIKNRGAICFTIWLIHLFEWKSATRIIKLLHETVKAKIVINK